MPDPYLAADRPDRDVTLTAIKVGLTRMLTDEALARMPQASASARADLDRDPMLRGWALRLRAEILAERLPPETLRGEVADVRWATWFDHLKATIRDRWWAAALVRRWPPRTVEVPIRVSVPVQGWWTYPHAPYTTGAGYPVLKFDISPPASWHDDGNRP